MTTNQLSANANIQYTSVRSGIYASKLTFWTRLLLALHIILNKDIFMDQTPSKKDFINMEAARKATPPFDPYATQAAFDAFRVA